MDVVINHMVGINGEAGVGTGGSPFDTATLDFPGVPYSWSDFNCCHSSGTGNCEHGATCYTSNCEISDYSNAEEVRYYSNLSNNNLLHFHSFQFETGILE